MKLDNLKALSSRPGTLIFGWHLLMIALASVAGAMLGWGPALLVLASGVLLLVIALLWSSLQSLTGEAGLTLEEALSMAPPRAEEEQKRAILRALKDLEYERSVGKVSEEDYAQLSASYRQQAKELIRSLDADLSPIRASIDELVAARLAGKPAPAAPAKKKKRRKAEPATAAVEPASTPDTVEEAATPALVCSKCQVHNDTDARFCKACGTELQGA